MRGFSLSVLLAVPLGLVLCSPANGQDETSVGDAARQAKAAKSSAPSGARKVITNETLDVQGNCSAPVPSSKEAGPDHTVRAAFLRRIGGRWKLSYLRKGNQTWWPDHGKAQPKNQIHYLFGPTELLVESRPEFNPPSVTARLVYGSVLKISADLFDLALQKPCEPGSEEIKRFKISAGGKTLEIAADAEGNPEPTVRILELVDANWADAVNPQ
jgi:hypothetical protein